MTLPEHIIPQRRWVRIGLAVTALLYTLYVALAYLYLPGKLKTVVEQDVASLIGRDIQVQRIGFNPFTLAVEVEQFAVADRPQKPLLGWQRFYVNLDAWGSLFGWCLRLTQVELDGFQLNIERRPETFNFSDILARFASEEPTQPEQEKTQFALQVDAIQIQDGDFVFDDISGSKPATSALNHVTIGVRNLYLATGDDQLNPFQLQADMPGGGNLNLQGEFRADPLLVHSRVILADISLPTFADFIENLVPLQLHDGKLNAQAQITLEQQQQFQLQVQQGSVSVNGLALDDAQRDPPLLRMTQLDISGIALDLLQQTVSVEKMVLDGVNTQQWLKEGGELRIQPLLATQPETAAPAQQPPAETQPWALTLNDIRLQNSQVQFTDFTSDMAATQSLTDLNVQLKDLTLVPNHAVPLLVSAKLNQSGQLSVDGELTLQPFALNLNYQMQELPLAPFNPYLAAQSWLQLQQGTLTLDGKVALTSEPASNMTVGLNLTLSDVAAQDTRNEQTLLRWHALNVQQMQFDQQQNQLTIAQVLWQQPEIAAEIDAQQQMNLAGLMKPSVVEVEPVAPVSNDASAPLRIVVENLQIENGTTRFRDASVEPTFKSGLYNLQFQLQQLTSHGQQPARFSLSSKIDKYAPFSAKGTLAPLQKQPGFAFTSKLEGLEMPGLSPYTGTYIGYQLQSGTLALDLNYELQQRHLKGNNNIVAKKLFLGDAVASDKAVDAPVGLGLALLRDSSGVIDLDVGVGGDLDEPGFSVSGVVLKALMNVIVKAATSPFQLLGSLVGGAEDLGTLSFDAGSKELDDPAREKLKQLVEALQQRPQLVLDVTGSASAEADSEALQLNKVLAAVAARRKSTAPVLNRDALLADGDNRKILQVLNKELQLPGEGDRIKTLRANGSTLEGPALSQQIYQQMLVDVMTKQAITQQELLQLADQRALTIKQYLVDEAGLDHGRVQMTKSQKANLQGRDCTLGLKTN